jgi:FKBP-type peptidyl-prolyl cis-trans isomerase
LISRFFFILIVAGVLFGGCHIKNSDDSEKEISPSKLKEPLIQLNKQDIETEEKQIADFLTRYGWEMEETGTGLRYMIYQKGNGPKSAKGKLVSIAFTVSLLNGTICYSSDEEGEKEFVLGLNQVESGLEEGIILMRTGDKAKFILPSHLGHGLIGDLDKIPQKVTLVYDVELLRVKER